MPELGHLEAVHGGGDRGGRSFEDPGVDSQVHREQPRLPPPPAPPTARRARPRPYAPQANRSPLRSTEPLPQPLSLRAHAAGPAPRRPIAARHPLEAPPRCRRPGRAGPEVTCGALSAPGPAERAGLGATAVILWLGICLGRLSSVRGTPFPGRRETRSELAPLRRLGTLSGRDGPLARVTQIVAAEGSPGLMQIPIPGTYSIGSASHPPCLGHVGSVGGGMETSASPCKDESGLGRGRAKLLEGNQSITDKLKGQ